MVDDRLIELLKWPSDEKISDILPKGRRPLDGPAMSSLSSSIWVFHSTRSHCHQTRIVECYVHTQLGTRCLRELSYTPSRLSVESSFIDSAARSLEALRSSPGARQLEKDRFDLWETWDAER